MKITPPPPGLPMNALGLRGTSTTQIQGLTESPRSDQCLIELAPPDFCNLIRGRVHQWRGYGKCTYVHLYTALSVLHNGDFFSCFISVLSLFTIVSFKNEACQSGTGNNGTCYSSSDCSKLGGTASGSCASGFGVCCLCKFSQRLLYQLEMLISV